jgi:type III secretion YscU/HrpY family protein
MSRASGEDPAMADKNDGGDKTEQPTPRKLRDARRQGNVWKSREATSTLVLLVWLVLGAADAGLAGLRLQALVEAALRSLEGDFAGRVRDLGALAAQGLVVVTAALLVPAMLAGALVEFLQVGPVLAFSKLKPSFDRLNPAEGLKRMFSADNLVEVVKSLLKTAVLAIVGWVVLRGSLPQFAALAGEDPHVVAPRLQQLLWQASVRLVGATVAAFAGLAILDAAWQRHAYLKKLRMSRRDIRDEHKQEEGDPYVKAQRRQTHKEWSERNAAQAARQADVLVVNPTHVAIALDYDHDGGGVPTVSAKGEDELARAMREAAEEAGVPIVRNVALARELLAGTEVGAVVPRHLFDVVAEVILWAREVREEIERQRRGEPAPPAARQRLARAPGEDATRYPGRGGAPD